MRYSGIDKAECCNGIGWGVSLYTQGCSRRCKGCFNQETWDFDGGKKFTQETINTILKLIEPEYITRLSILGGEPLEDCNWVYLDCLCFAVKKHRPDIQIWIYTGYTYEKLQCLRELNGNTDLDKLLNWIDVLVDGPFQEDKKDLTYPFAGSTNQSIINMRKTREQNKIVLLDI